MKKACIFFLLLALTACQDSRGPGRQVIGFKPSPLYGFLALARDSVADSTQLSLLPFAQSDAIGFALLAHKISAAFLDPESALELLKAQPKELRPIGVLEFPYGSTIVVRKGLALRLPELANHKVARNFTACRLTRQVQKDAPRLQLPLDSITWVPMPLDEMIPALESGLVDAAVLNGSRAILAQAAGHTILYQNWETTEGDECCPAIIAQAEAILVAHRKWVPHESVLAALEATNALTPAQLRHAGAELSGYPDSLLSEIPLPTFRALSPAGADSLLQQISANDSEDHHNHVH